MGALLNAYFTYAKSPAQALGALIDQRRFSAALWGYGVAAVCWVVFFWTGDSLSSWGLLWRLVFFFLLEVTVGYVWAALSGLFLNFFSNRNGSSALFVVLGLSGFTQGILMSFALIATAFSWLKPLLALCLVITLLLRFVFIVINTSLVAEVGRAKAFCVLCFALVPASAIGVLLFLAPILILSWIF